MEYILYIACRYRLQLKVPQFITVFSTAFNIIIIILPSRKHSDIIRKTIRKEWVRVNNNLHYFLVFNKPYYICVGNTIMLYTTSNQLTGIKLTIHLMNPSK